MAPAFFHGFVLAIGLILPLGVQNFFVFSRGALGKRFSTVFPVVVTASLCDTLLILLAVYGVSLVVMSFIWVKTALLIAGLVFLVYMGFVTWKSKSDRQSADAGELGLARSIGFTAMISLLNPHAILDTVGVIGTSSMDYKGSVRIAYTAGCLLVSWLWFASLALAGRFIGMKDKNGRLLGSLNKVSAVVMWAAAIYLLRSFW
ncbi:LysE/ArgO family amino acid transporter [Cohnella suwonensis]|uniref:LysE/ArgO family amino acid transporter n=1 Tax=Cohnella suwonensis TaxID=696072 RepID=A0ABW0M622_9BACL